MELVRALLVDLLWLTTIMLITYGCLRLIEMLAPRTSFDASSQIKSLRFWPFYIGAIVVCSRAGIAIFSHWQIDPLFRIDGRTVYEASHLGLLNYIVWPVISLICLDFFHYWKHRAQHKFFWNYHAVHHSIENLSTVNSYHHWTDPIFSLALVTIPMGLLIGMDTPTFAVVSGLIFLQGPFIHSNTRLHLGIANRVLVDNRFHRIHHSIEEGHFDKNFGERTTIWDQVFGTAYFPKSEEWPDTGVSGTPEPRGTADYFWAPFKSWALRSHEDRPTVTDDSRDRHGGSDDLNGARKALAWGVICSFAATIIFPAIMGFEVNFRSFWPIALLASVPATFIPYVAWRQMWLFRSVLELTSVSFLLVLPCLVVSYSSMRFNMPMADATLIQMDRAIGFDWPAFVRFVDRSALGAGILEVAYQSLLTQLVVLPVLLCIFHHQARAYQYMLSFIVLGLVASVISIPFPSVGAYVGYGLDGATLRNINAQAGYLFLESFSAIREQEHFVLASNNAAGIITFPSGHAGFAVLCAWAAWPSRWLRLPVLALSTLMVIAAITHGAHYLVDVIAGVGAASAAIWLVTRQFPGLAAFRSLGRMSPAALQVSGGLTPAPPIFTPDPGNAATR